MSLEPELTPELWFTYTQLRAAGRLGRAWPEPSGWKVAPLHALQWCDYASAEFMSAPVSSSCWTNCGRPA